MNLVNVCLIFLSLVFSSCSGQSNSDKSINEKESWRTTGNNNQRTGFIDVDVMRTKPSVKMKRQAINDPIIGNGIAYFFEDSDKVLAFDFKNERDLWKIDLGFPANKLTIDKNSTIYIAGQRNIVAINVLTERKLWQINTNPSLISGITVSDNMLYRSGNALTAYDALTGKELWSFEPFNEKKKDVFFGIPAISNNILYIGGENSDFYALDTETGKEIWRIKKEIIGNPVYAAGKVFIVHDRSLYAIDASTGKEVWSTDFKQITSPPVIGNGAIYISSIFTNNTGAVVNVRALAIDTGREEWKKEFKGLISNLVITRNALIFGITEVKSPVDLSGTLHALDLERGNELWKTTINNSAIMSEIVTIHNAILYTGTQVPNFEDDSVGHAMDYLYILK